MYYLMNKDKVVAAFFIKSVSELDRQSSFELKNIEDNLPYGFLSINNWIDNRSAAKHNKHLERIMKQLNCFDREGFLRLTHAASVNDTFWVKSDSEIITWQDISLYRNQFTESISRLAFEGVGLYNGSGFSETSPELAIDGHFRKCFKKEDNVGQYNSDIFIYKRGLEFGMGIEPYCEVLSSEIASIIAPLSSVRYEIVELHDKTSSKCNLFTNERFGYAAFSKIMSHSESLDEVFDYFKSIGSEQQFREMMVIDSLCLNRDRHKGNFGVLFDNETMEIIEMSPIFDLNLSLLSYMNNDDIHDISVVNEELSLTTPRLGRDFTELGQSFVNDSIKSKLRDLEDYSFSFRGDDVFTEDRIISLEKYIKLQARSLLNEKKCFVKDVFTKSNLEESDTLDLTHNNLPKR